MADYYEINPFKREVSLAVLPTDAYTGKPVTRKRVSVIVKGAGQDAVVKNDGYHVFVNLPDGLWHVNVGGEEFFTEKLTVETPGGKGKYINVRLIPNSRYRLPRGATFIEYSCAPGAEIYAFPTGRGELRLRKQTENGITVQAAQERDYSRLLFAFCEDGEPYVFEMGEKTGKSTYKVSLDKRYDSGAEIYPVSVGRADTNGRLLCPLRGFGAEHSEILICAADGENGFCVKREIVYGKGNAIKL